MYPFIKKQIEDILNEKWPDIYSPVCKYVSGWPCTMDCKCTDACPIYLAKKSGATGVTVQAKIEPFPFNICPIDTDYCERNFDCHRCPRGEV